MRTGRKSIWCGIVAALFILTAAFVVTAQEAQQAPDVISIKADLWKEHTKAPVELTHKKHVEEYNIACADCHHVYEDGKNVWKEGDHVQKCQECHTEPTIQGEKKLPEDQQKLNLKLAFHENCQGCHKTVKKDKPDTTAPVTCTGCHPGSK